MTDNKLKCPVCQSSKSKLAYKKYPGYLAGTGYNIYACGYCDSNFIDTSKIDDGLYDKIYSSPELPGYERYLEYAKQVKREKKPLKYLSKMESTYFPVYKYLKNKKDLKILEVGCGYGYTSFAMKTLGFNVTGIDMSNVSIEFAEKNFGDFYKNESIQSFSKQSDKKFDLVVTTEVIEHLTDPNEFLSSLKSLLKTNGKILLTTPNRNYYSMKSVWQTDLPPVHTVWISRKGLIEMAIKHGFRYNFIKTSGHYSSNYNYLINYIKKRKESIQASPLLENGNINPLYKKTRDNSPKSLLKWFMIKCKITRTLANFIHGIIKKEGIELAILLEK